MNIPLRIRNLIARHDTANPYRIAKELKIEIIFTKTPSRVHGFWRRILRRKIIYIDETLSEDWQIKAVISHEIGHILLHPKYAYYCMSERTYLANSRKEDEADRFSAELLSYCCSLEKEYVLDFLKNSWKT
ncbi:MAG: hypothetical protein H6Q67_2244 [Firmicutes bacterium]|nr:hypothetical protein [Bacillota bacterium]